MKILSSLLFIGTLSAYLVNFPDFRAGVFAVVALLFFLGVNLPRPRA